MKELIIDRFEEGYVVCETPEGQFDALPRKNLPPEAEEGSVLLVQDDGTIMVDIEKTLRRRAANMYRLKNMLCKRKEQYQQKGPEKFSPVLFYLSLCRSLVVGWCAVVSRKKKEMAQTPANATSV